MIGLYFENSRMLSYFKGGRILDGVETFRLDSSRGFYSTFFFFFSSSSSSSSSPACDYEGWVTRAFGC